MKKAHSLISKKPSKRMVGQVKSVGSLLVEVGECLKLNKKIPQGLLTKRNIEKVNEALGVVLEPKILKQSHGRGGDKRIGEALTVLGGSLLDGKPFIDDSGYLLCLYNHLGVDVYGSLPTKTDLLKNNDFAFFENYDYVNKVFWGTGRYARAKYFYFPYQYALLNEGDKKRLEVAERRYERQAAKTRSEAAKQAAKTRRIRKNKEVERLDRSKESLAQIKKLITAYCDAGHKKPLFIDTETTGLSVDDEVIELAVCDIDGFIIVDTLIYAEQAIHPKAKRVHGISEEDIQNKPKLSEFTDDLKRLFKDRELMIYNADFDIDMLNRSCKEKVSKDAKSIECVMLQYAEYVGEWLDYVNDYRWHSLDQACRNLEIKRVGSHRALNDVMATIKVYKKIIDEGA